MNLKPYHLSILRFVATYRTVTRAMIQAECLSKTDRQGRFARKVLGEMFHEGLVCKTTAQIVFDGNGATSRVYYPSRRGCEVLAEATGEEKWFDTCTLAPSHNHLLHWVSIAEFQLMLDKAVSLQADVTVEKWLTEWTIANPRETDPAKRYSLFTEIQKEPRLVCAPDAGWLLSFRGHRIVIYLEYSRGTSGIQQIANSKTKGYAALAAGQLHRRHFPDTNYGSFSVLAVEPTVNRRDLLRKAIATKPGADLWRFMAWPEMSPQSLLFSPIMYDCHKGPYPLVRRAEGGAK